MLGFQQVWKGTKRKDIEMWKEKHVIYGTKTTNYYRYI